jgi:hypothetical protein
VNTINSLVGPFYAGMFAGLLLFVVITQLKLWPGWFYRITRAVVRGGPHKGRVGVLTGVRKNRAEYETCLSRHEVFMDLASALRTDQLMICAPVEPLSAFVLFMRDQPREAGGDDTEGLRRGYKMYLELLPEDKDEYERNAIRLRAIMREQLARWTAMEKGLGYEYEVKLHACEGEEASTEFVLGSDLELRSAMNIRDFYEERMMKLKLTVSKLQVQ